MSHLTSLKAAANLTDVAKLVGFKPAALSYVLYKKGVASNYIKFEIPKRHGGTRKISAPMTQLKLIQQRLANVLQNCVEEINAANGWRDGIAHGFKRKRSIITNAKQHRRRRYVFNVDLKGFFDAINFGRVRGYFIKDNEFSLHADVATVLAQIICYENALPQGSPCSPIVSNLIGHVLDIHLARMAARAGCTYTRYADDLTFSTNRRQFPENIAKGIEPDKHAWVPGLELAGLVRKSGFEINPLKTRMQYRDSRQEVTGLIVNRKLNVRSEYRHTVRAMVHRLINTGSIQLVRHVIDANGNVTATKLAGTSTQLHGMLSFIEVVDRYNKKLSAELTKSSSSKEAIYRRFLLFKEFYAASRPVLICEGKTDNVYLVHAIRSLAAAYPRLATTNADGTIKLNVRIFKYSGSGTGRVLGIDGGSADLCKLIWTYQKEKQRFKAPGLINPVVLVIDNDSGAKSIYGAVEKITGTKPKGTENFLHVTGNLYVVATPLPFGTTAAKIEDCFDAAAKSMIVDGKHFNPENDIDFGTHYGKMDFALKVVRKHADSIDFSGFAPLLTSIVAVIDAHEKKNAHALSVGGS
jgi:RNA-directed DNA polymerase